MKHNVKLYAMETLCHYAVLKRAVLLYADTEVSEQFPTTIGCSGCHSHSDKRFFTNSP